MTKKRNEAEKLKKKVEIEDSQEEKEERKDSDPDRESPQKDPEDEVVEAEIVDEEEDQVVQEEKTEESPDRARLIRLQADFENFKRRTEKDRQDTIKYANEKLILKLVDVVDNFHRALETEREEKDSFYEGMELIFAQLTDVLEEEGLEAIDPTGEAFDPNFHDAVLSEESEEVPSGHVIETMRKGYTLKGRLIRPAMVKVAQ
ncbi:nucleotide exchange factor GrpE [Kallipyga massiliensis]|uniref:nucleotide exchange factor GrpE n=1 Tax=Kallipyga massiliensis TaxID=1472764 RepID=UPI0004B63A53|nr:nucleotide exchange factor GrpE [Kallipyga massiliensis]